MNYQKRKLLWINFLSTILWTLSKVKIFFKIFGKRFFLLAAFLSLHKSHFPIWFCVGCCLSFKRPMCRQHVFYVQITGIGISIECQTANSRNKLQRRDTTLLKRIVYEPKPYQFWFIPFLILIYSGFPRCVCSEGYYLCPLSDS